MPTFFKSKWVLGAIVAVLILGAYFFLRPAKSAYEFVTVTKGSITESVSVTGNTTPVESVSLGFGSGGVVEHVYSKVGNKISAGSVLAELDTSDLSAQLQEAQASVDAQKAKLSGLQAGSRPEDIAAAQAAYDKAQQDLENLYSAVSDTISDGYAKAVDAVKTELSAFFSNPDSDSPHLTFLSSASQAVVDSQNKRASVGTSLAAWQGELAALPDAGDASLEASITADLARLTAVRDFLTSVSVATNAATNLDATTLATYKSDIAAALTETNTAIKNLNTTSQEIASQKLTVAQAKAGLDLKKAGSTAQDIAAQQAQVENAEASVESIRAKIGNAEIVAPISGTVTQFDAKVGQVASAGTPLVSIISSGAFEVEADVPEIDIGKISVGNPVVMTLDAFANETFQGSVFYIDPAETVTQGVVNYKVKVAFAKPDPRMKSGLTTNLEIQTKHKEDVLILPQYAIVQNDQGSFVRILQNKVATDTPVTLGIEDANGNVEIESGVSEGQAVVNIGLKQ